MTGDKNHVPGEPLSNIELLCDDCSPKPIPVIPDQLKVGGCVKRRFEVLDSQWKDKVGYEHMWVRIMKVLPGEEKLVGKLANVPLYADHLSFGDKIEVGFKEIEAVCD